MLSFRLYSKNGCPYCESAVNWFKEHNVFSEVVNIGNDPILNAGVKANGDSLPMLVCFESMKIVKGFQPDEYQRQLAILIERNNPQSFTVVEPESVNPGEAAKVDGAETPPPRLQ